MALQLDYAEILQIKEIESFEDRIQAAAAMYARQGFYVIPLRRNQKAIPGKKYNFNYSNATKHLPTVNSWFGPGGKFRGWNLGLACGADEGIFVVDVDTKEPKDGRPALAAMEKDHGKFNGLVQRTPSDGLHYVFEWFDGGTSSTDKLAKGIDTRGGKGRCSSHIVAWPSEIEGVAYEWERTGIVPETPEFIMDMMGTPWDMEPQGGPGRGNENLDDEALEQQYTPRELWKMLGKIDPNSLTYDEWVNVGMALHSQHDDEKGFKLWQKWSEQGDRHEQGECEARWSGFKPYGPVRIGTIVHFAMKGGYVPTPKMVAEEEAREALEGQDELEQMIEAMNERFGVALVGGKIRIMAQEVNQDPDRDLVLLSLDDFKTMCMNDKMVITGAQGQPKVVPKAAVWMADERRKDYMGGIDFNPEQAAEFETPNGLCMNLWRGWAKQPRPGDWSKLRAHIEQIVCAGDETYYTWVLDWMADLFQDPANPKGCALVMHGLEGCGKGTLVEAIGRTMGRHYKHLVHEKHLTGEFNGHLQDALLVFADELVYGGSKKTAGALKAMVTEKMLMTERKGVDAQRGRNCAHLCVASNEDWFIPAGPEARRWFVLEVLPTHCKNPEWFEAIYEEMENGGIEAMMYDLMDREITSNLKRAPATKSLKMQQAMYANSVRDSTHDWWLDCIEKLEVDAACVDGAGEVGKGWPLLIIKPELYDAYSRWCDVRKVPGHQVDAKNLFYMKMDKYGLTETIPKKKEYVQKMGGRKRCYKIPLPEVALDLFRKGGGRP